MYMAMINIHNIHNNMYLLICTFTLVIHPFIGMVLISTSLFSPMETVLSPLPILFPPPILSDSPTLENQYWSPYQLVYQL